MKFYMTPGKHGLGWLPDLPDQRDYIFTPKVTYAAAAELPASTDLRKECPDVYDQGQLGSCTANALAAAFDFDRHRQGKPFMTPSRLFVYWNERSMEGTVDSDAGARIRDGVKVLVKQGTPREAHWPYDIAEFTVKPPKPVFDEALENQALTYQRIVRPVSDPVGDMLRCLASGFPFVSGISVYESFEAPTSAKTGVIPMPRPDEQLLGGHAILVVGYDQAKQHFICRNSWGTAWGLEGYFYMPYEYLASEKLSSDMWLVRTVEV